MWAGTHTYTGACIGQLCVHIRHLSKYMSCTGVCFHVVLQCLHILSYTQASDYTHMQTCVHTCFPSASSSLPSQRPFGSTTRVTVMHWSLPSFASTNRNPTSHLCFYTVSLMGLRACFLKPDSANFSPDHAHTVGLNLLGAVFSSWPVVKL